MTSRPIAEGTGGRMNKASQLEQAWYRGERDALAASTEVGAVQVQTRVESAWCQRLRDRGTSACIRRRGAFALAPGLVSALDTDM